jgi:8-oxo-dGTP pyrophosphatase MutT (NUDIX family)
LKSLQYAALPYRFHDGELQVLLVTSRESRRWIIPKGWPMRRLAPHRVAEREAWEEAGVRGRARPRAVGSFSYVKRHRRRGDLPCDVTVYPLAVRVERTVWPEAHQRDRRWFSVADAARVISDRAISEIFAAFCVEVARREIA